MELELWSVAVCLVAAAIFSGFIHSAVGFGFGIVAIALMPFIIDARSAHVAISISSVPMLITAAWAYRDGLEDWRSLQQAVIGAAIFVPIGLLLFESVSLDWLVRGTGLGVLAMVIWSLRNRRRSDVSASSRGACFVAGATAGFLAGAVSIAGPPIAAFALKQQWPQLRFKAFVTQCLLVIAAYKASLLILRGYWTWNIGWQVLLLSLSSMIGVQLGFLASQRISAGRFRVLVAIALILVACIMIFRGSGEGRGSKSITTEQDAVGEAFRPGFEAAFEGRAATRLFATERIVQALSKQCLGTNAR